MKKKSKIAIAATAAITAGALAISLPSLAHDGQKKPGERGGMGVEAQKEGAYGKMMSKGSFVSVSAEITSVPADVTSLREAAKGANFGVYRLADDATVLPEAKPEAKSRIMGFKPAIDETGNPELPEIIDGDIQATLSFKTSGEAGVKKFAVYPSDGSDPILVTMTTDAAGATTITSSADLTVSYSEIVAATSEQWKMKKGGYDKKGHGKMGNNKDLDPAEWSPSWEPEEPAE
ncbi:MAG: hypothetical protein P8M68_04170 [Aquiluna sp.]|nr:hypothetical protein [Aquiluna sp.]